MSSKPMRLKDIELAASRDSVKVLVSLLVGLVAAFWLASSVYAYASSMASDISKGTVVALFWSQTCPHCMQILPIWRELEAEQPFLDKGVRLADVSLQSPMGPQLFMKYGVTGTPTLVVLRNGKLVAAVPGPNSVSKEGILAEVEQLLSMIEENTSLASPATSEQATAGTGALQASSGLSVVGSMILYAGLGALTALSPCSLPVLLAYFASGRGMSPITCLGAGFVGTLALAMLLAIAAAFIVKALTLLPLAFAVLVFYAGLLSIVGASHSVLRGVRVPASLACVAYPFIAAQCNLPLVLAGFASITVAATTLSAVSFAVGMSIPLALAAASARLVDRLLKTLLGRRGEMVTGLLLVLAGVVLALAWVWGV